MYNLTNKQFPIMHFSYINIFLNRSLLNILIGVCYYSFNTIDLGNGFLGGGGSFLRVPPGAQSPSHPMNANQQALNARRHR